MEIRDSHKRVRRRSLACNDQTQDRKRREPQASAQTGGGQNGYRRAIRACQS